MSTVTFHYHDDLRARFLENRQEDDPRRAGESLLDRLREAPKAVLTSEPHAGIIKEMSCLPLKGEEWGFRYFFSAAKERLVPLAVTFQGKPCCASEEAKQMHVVKSAIQYAAMSCFGYGVYRAAQN